MQFYLNGFSPGDPTIATPQNRRGTQRPRTSQAEEIDVLIVGCGPAGLTLAAQLASFPDIHTRIVDKKSGPLELGQADGIACRTMEMFQAFGFAERLMKEAYWVNETVFWKPDDANRKRIVRAGRVQDVEDGLSEMPHVILNQARVHDFYLEVMRHAPTRLVPDYDLQLVDLEISSATSSHPVTVRLERLDPGRQGQVEMVKARYVVGCDGARSAVRQSLGRELRGDSANQAWGVMDVLAITDFPDVRLKAAVQSASSGNLLIIPREGGYLIRIYVELDELNENERITNRQLTVDHIIDAAKRILVPFTLDVKEVVWWSVYEIGQRLCDSFDNVSGDNSNTRVPSVFIAGDACHTHSPKAGQGMNVSMQDSFNLGWKLASVLQGQCVPELLHSYSEERQAIAEELIDFDREWAKMFSDPPKDDTGLGVDPAEFQRYFVKQGRFTAGTATRYETSLITGESTYQSLAKGFPVGMRFHSAPVIRLADAKPLSLGHVIEADGRWRLFAFCDLEAPSSAIASLCAFLANSPTSPIRRYTEDSEDIDSVIDVRAVFQQDHRVLESDAMPPLLQPKKGRYGLQDYEKMFCPDLRSGHDIFDMRGIDRQRGCLVVVRPDQYVAHILPLDAYEELGSFFDRFMLA